MPPSRRTVNDLLRERASHWPDAVTPMSHLMMRVYRVAGVMHENAVSQAAAHGLSFTELEVLVTLRGAAPPHELAPGALCAAMLISSGGLTKVLYALEERGLVARPPGGTDRRSKPVGLTPQGRRLAEAVMADLLASSDALIGGALSGEEVAQLTGLLRKLLARLEPGGGPETPE